MKRFGEVFTEFNGESFRSEYPDTSAMTRTASVRFTRRLYVELKEQAERQNTTMSALVRQYITEAVNKTKKENAEDAARLKRILDKNRRDDAADEPKG